VSTDTSDCPVGAEQTYRDDGVVEQVGRAADGVVAAPKRRVDVVDRIPHEPSSTPWYITRGYHWQRQYFVNRSAL
jgi:hypothetical protein